MIPIEPMMIGAAVSALPRVIEALPKPGEFADFLREMVTGTTAADTEAEKGQSTNVSSFEAQKQQAHGRLSSWTPGGLGAISLSGIFRELSETVDQFRDSFAQLLEEHGIDRSEEIHLGIDTTGKARVQGDRADAVQIESLFEQNPELRNQLAMIDSYASMLRAAQQDPGAGAKSASPATFVVGEDSFDILFD